MSGCATRGRAALQVALACGALLLVACGGESAGAPTTSAPEATTTTTTIVASTTTAATTTTIAPTTTTTSTTTTTVPTQKTRPIPPPSDPYASEPVIELGSLAIPRLGVDMTMYEGIRLTTLDYGPGHWPGSAMPGEPGNVVVAGHRTSKHQVFRHIDELEPGDEIVFTDAAGEHVYTVTRVEIIEPTELWIVDPTATPTVTLFACHPPGSTAQRIAAFGELVSG